MDRPAPEDKRENVCAEILNPQTAEPQAEDWEGTEQPEEGTEGQMAPKTLDRRVLQLLSAEDEKHMERILEEIREFAAFSDSAKPEVSVSLSQLVSCLMRLKIDGRVEESPTGYYRKI